MSKLDEYKQKIKLIEKDKVTYPESGFVYVITPTKDTNLHKIGHTGNLKKRMSVYNTAYPDTVDVAFKIPVKKTLAVEQCMKSALRSYIYRDKKEFYKVSLNKIKTIMINCKKLIDGKLIEKNVLKRMTVQKDKDDDIGLYSIIIAPIEETEQKGGNLSNIQKSILLKESIYKSKELCEHYKSTIKKVHKFSKII